MIMLLNVILTSYMGKMDFIILSLMTFIWMQKPMI